jgi:hypothetical protein
MPDVFSDPRSCFQDHINKIASEDVMKPVIEDIIKLQLARESEKNDKMLPLCEMYNLLGAQQFSELVELMNGRSVTFPRADSFKETVQIAICFYFKYLRNKKWEEIKEILNDDEISSIKMGIKTNHLRQFITKMTQIVNSRKRSE